jgi:hypothetical protein
LNFAAQPSKDRPDIAARMADWRTKPSGVDFEKRIAASFRKRRTAEHIQFETDQLQRELDEDTAAGQLGAGEKLRIQSFGLPDCFSHRLWLAGAASLVQLLPPGPISFRFIQPGANGNEACFPRSIAVAVGSGLNGVSPN